MRLFRLFSLALGIAGSVAAEPEKIADRRNIADAIYGSFAEVTNADGTKKEAPGVISGRTEDNNAVRLDGVPATLTVTFAAPTQINLIRLYPGMVVYADYPSGDSGIADYVVERFNNGYWHKIVEAKGQPGFRQSGAESGRAYCYEHTFRPVNAAAVRITVTKSGFTGRTASSPDVVPEAKRHSYLRAVEVYEARKSTGGLARLDRAVAGDFRLPVYRDQAQAELHLKLDPFLKSLELEITAAPEKGGPAVATKKITLQNEAKIPFKLADFPDGRYFVTLKPAAEKGSVKGEIRRMLRIDRGGQTPPPAEPVELRDSRIFPVDDYHFARREGVSNTVIPATPVETSKSLGPTRTIQRSRAGNWFGVDDAGNFVQMFTDYDFNSKDPKTYYAWSRDRINWQQGPEPPSGTPNKIVPSPYDPLPAAAVPRWGVKTQFKDARIRFYEEADGRPPLNEIRVQCIGVHIAGSAQAITDRGLIPWGTYPVWEKNRGEWIILRREPLQVCKFGFEADELEQEHDSNDNFAPQLLSDDGKTLFYSQAAKLRTFPPYTIEYDNLRQAKRIMKTFYTHDGFNYESRFILLPTEDDHWSMQHYGFAANRVAKDFYLGYIAAYPASTQQIYPEVMYSRDALNWVRLPNQPPFIANTAPRTWLFGMNFPESSPPPFEFEGKYFFPIGTSFRRQHFYPEHTNLAHPERITGDHLRRSYADRNLEKEWPYFKAIGGWDGLAEEIKQAGNTVGYAEFRKDGWIAVRAGRDGGLLESRLLSSPGQTLKLNGKGDFTLTLLDAAGRPLPGYTAALAGDHLDTPVAWQNGKPLPAAPCRLRIVMKPAAELYCLYLTP